MKLRSPVFNDGEAIPEHFTCNGENVNPALIIEDLPEDTQSLALTVIDPTSTYGTWVHWLIYNMPPLERIEEGSAPGKQGVNSFGNLEYGGPCPVAGTHTYVFTLYALDNSPSLPAGAHLDAFLQEIDGHVITKAMLKGSYSKPPVPFQYEEINI
jgi:Raf kinase inhibitor-like YbhB/YbcL family protein